MVLHHTLRLVRLVHCTKVEELGYSLSHATGAILDNPDLIAATVVGDGEAETSNMAG